MFLLKIFVIIGLLKMLNETDQPFLCAGIYAIVAFGLGLAFGGSLAPVAVASVIAFAFAALYFWLLSIFPEGAPHWGILIVGLAIGLV